MFTGLVHQPDQWIWAAKAVAAGLTALAAALLAVPAARRWIYPPLSEDSLRDQILFDRVLRDGYTIRCTDGALIVTISLGGVNLSSLRRDEIEEYFTRRKMWLDKISGFDGINCMCLSSRRYHNHQADCRGYDDQWQRAVQQEWHAGFRRSFRNSHVLVLWVKGGSQSAPRILAEAVDTTLMMLTEFKPFILRLGQAGEPSPLLGVWASILNPGRDVTLVNIKKQGNQLSNMVPVTGSRDCDYIIDRRLADTLISTVACFNQGLDEMGEDGIMVFSGGPDKVRPDETWVAAVVIKVWGDVSKETIMQKVMSVDAEILLAQWVECYNTVKGQQIVADKERRSLTLRLSSRAIDQFAAATELLQGGAGDGQTLCRHQATVFVYASSRSDLEKRLKLVNQAFGEYSIVAARAGAIAESLWMSLFPPQMEWARSCQIFSGNVAHFLSFEIPSQGQTICDWGPRPVTVFRTVSGSPYSFCFHTSTDRLATGHTVMIGATGSGKTVMANFLAMSALGYPDLHAYIFDRHDGAYVPIKAFGGSYVHLQTDAEGIEGGCNLNPMQMDIKPRPNGGGPGAWIISWLRDHICHVDDVESEAAISLAVKEMSMLPMESRSLTELYHNLPDNIAAKKQLERFVFGPYAAVFNCDRDTLDVMNTRFTGFDFTRVMEDEILAEPLISYLAYRIEMEMQAHNAPYLIVFDEAAALLRNDGFKKMFFNQLEEARKKRGVILSCFQRVGTLVETGTAELLMGQCPTMILFKNEAARPEDYIDGLGLTQSDFDIISNRHPQVRGLARYMLIIRQGEGSVILNTDFLSYFSNPDYLRLFGSGRGPADEVRRLERERPGDWVSRLVGSAPSEFITGVEP